MFTDYDHNKESHTVSGAYCALEKLLPKLGGDATSLLDVGCGVGTWLEAASQLGIDDLKGLEGGELDGKTVYRSGSIECVDLRKPFRLGRKFDLLLCLEVAEHLEEIYADDLISSLVAHSDKILFSAAVPGQPGQHHVNCQWPSYWQKKFGDRGFVCRDWPRWDLWETSIIEPHYRQNLMLAERAASVEGATKILSVVHPELLTSVGMRDVVWHIENGSQPLSWYLTVAIKAVPKKVRRWTRRGGRIRRGLDI